jgi:hypothetical protein
MTKEELLKELGAKIATGEIQKSEIAAWTGIQNDPLNAPKLASEKVSVNKMLYFFGAAIVTIGIIIFVGQIWGDIGAPGHILVTLGLGLAFALSGSMLMKKRPEEKIGQVFHSIGGILIPAGAMVAISELEIEASSVMWPVAITFALISLFYLFLNTKQKHPVLTLFIIANGTAAMYAALAAIQGGSFFSGSDNYAYLTMALGISYILIGKSFLSTWNQSLTRALYFLGSAGFYAAAFSQVFGSPLWQLIYFLLLFGGLILSVELKSRSILITSTLFLIAHVSYITGKYFADSIGWPFALILLGFIFIGLGYMSLKISRRYIS